MQNIYNLIGWNSVPISDIFNCYRANINGMWNRRKHWQEHGTIFRSSNIYLRIYLTFFYFRKNTSSKNTFDALYISSNSYNWRPCRRNNGPEKGIFSALSWFLNYFYIFADISICSQKSLKTLFLEKGYDSKSL